MHINQLVASIIDKRQVRSKLKVKSLIVSLFGDFATTYNQPMQLSTIIQMLGLFGIKESLVRITVNRIMKLGWISYKKKGRASLYSINRTGSREFELFSQRIYGKQWNHATKSWNVVLIDKTSSLITRKLRRHLLWLGYSSINSRVFIRPHVDNLNVSNLICSLGLKDNVIIGKLNPSDQDSENIVVDHVKTSLAVRTVNQAYLNFLSIYDPIWQHRSQLAELDHVKSFMLRLLMIHDYRRIVLRSPDLPRDVLPNDWQGVQAHQLLSKIYQTIAETSSLYFSHCINCDTVTTHNAVQLAVNRFIEDS